METLLIALFMVFSINVPTNLENKDPFCYSATTAIEKCAGGGSGGGVGNK